MMKLFPARESLVSDIPTGDGKTANLFLRCYVAERVKFIQDGGLVVCGMDMTRKRGEHTVIG